MTDSQDAVDELYYYTLAHGDPAFIHQHAVDAIAAQTATENDRPIKLTFALVGLYLHVEKQFTGRQVQLVHMKMGRHKHDWPIFSLPEHRGAITLCDVLAAQPGLPRDDMIHQWCAAVWEAFAGSRATVIRLLSDHDIE